MNEKFLGKQVIVRGDRSGVFYGTLEAKDGKEVLLSNCRRLWYWSGAASISQIAAEGVKNPTECKFTVYVNEILIMDVIEIIPCGAVAVKSIEEVPVWKM